MSVCLTYYYHFQEIPFEVLKAPPLYKHIEDGHLAIGEQLPTVHNQHGVIENIQVLKLNE